MKWVTREEARRRLSYDPGPPYPRPDDGGNLDTYSDEELAAEVKRRAEARAKGRCPHCGAGRDAGGER